MSNIHELIARARGSVAYNRARTGRPESLTAVEDLLDALELEALLPSEDIPNMEAAPPIQPMPESASGCLYGCP